MTPLSNNCNEQAALVVEIRDWGRLLGFQQIAIALPETGAAAGRLHQWLDLGYHGSMNYMARHAGLRACPADLVPGVKSIITARMDYLPEPQSAAWATLEDPRRGYIARYALGRDYHKVLRRRLKQLAQRLEARAGPLGYRVFSDSAPVMEKSLAAQSGLGWAGKHTNLLNRSGSWFFLGEIFTDLPLPPDPPIANHCGHCRACLDVCPTGALLGPYQLDARRCIAYLTIEQSGPIPVELRPLIGNRIFGCDDCQLVCPWNRFARLTPEADFHRHRDRLGAPFLVSLFLWNEAGFSRHTEGSPIRRAGYWGWLRNLAVALGNGPADPAAIDALRGRIDTPQDWLREHIQWALDRLRNPG